jgi:hypothetical protein
MDESVLRGMAKWPDVPAVYGWLALDCRGIWRLRGMEIRNPRSRAFIDRHYFCDEEGRWFFQNGPQRVFIDLDYTPWILRRDARGDLVTHTGLSTSRHGQAFVDEQGRLLLWTHVMDGNMAKVKGCGIATPLPAIGLIDDRELQGFQQCFVDRHGRPLDDALLQTWLEEPHAHTGQVFLTVADARLVVSSICAVHVPQRFGFVTRPRPVEDES